VGLGNRVAVGRLGRRTVCVRVLLGTLVRYERTIPFRYWHAPAGGRGRVGGTSARAVRRGRHWGSVGQRAVRSIFADPRVAFAVRLR